jgi:hypothetical protein
MVRHLKKLFFGKPEHNTTIAKSVVDGQLENLRKIWENENHNDTGLERILRLFLLSIQFLFPGIYIREIFSKRGLTYKNLAIEFYVLFKFFFPLVILFTEKSHSPVLLFLTVYLLTETVTYLGSLVFTSDIQNQTRSANRTILLLFVNYLEISLQFGVLFAGFDALTPNATTPIDYIYFSFVTSASVGFGDIHPTTQLGKMMVCCQSFLFLIFVVLFFNYFSSKRR